jgi:hypothetical protein
LLRDAQGDDLVNRHSVLPARRIDMNGMNARSLRDVIAVLTEQQKTVIAKGAPFAAHLIGLAIMELRLTVNEISEEELSELCDYLEVDSSGSDPVN